MRRLFALLGKELSQHGAAALGLGAFLLLTWLLCLLGTFAAPQTITLLETHALFVRVFVPLAGLVVGNRLVVREYHARTQRFLEALPLRRHEVVFEKLLLGLLLLSGLALLSLVATSCIAAFREPLTVRWLVSVFVRTQSFVFALWGLFFTMGLVGRWRVPLYIASAIAALVLDRLTSFEILEFGPVALVAQRFVLDRLSPGWLDVGVTVALGLGAIAAGLVLALRADGALAEAMARSMSRREKAAASILAAGALIVMSLVEAEAEEPPFSFVDERAVTRGGAHVLPISAAALALAPTLAATLEADRARVCAALSATTCPPVHVADHPTGPRAPQQVALSEDDPAVLVRARVGNDEDSLRVTVVSALIDRVTGTRASLEGNEWVRRGLARTVVSEGPVPDRVRWRAGWVARRRRPRFAGLERFHAMQERVGATPADAVAGLVGASIRDEVGVERWNAFAANVLGSEPPFALAAPLRAWLSPVGETLEDDLGLTSADVEARWSRALVGAAPGIARARAELSVSEDVPRTVRWALRFDRPPEGGSRCAFLHAPLGAFDVSLRSEEAPVIARSEQPCARSMEGELVGRYGPGERAFFGLEVFSPRLSSWLRVHAERRTIR